jgi:hypothetical protein
VIFERSRRSTLLAGVSSLLVGVASLATTIVLFVQRHSAAAGAATFLLAMTLIAISVRAARRLRAWPPGRLAFFRDRLVLLQGRLEQHMPWDRIEVATLGAGSAWTAGRASIISVTDRLTLQLKRWRGARTVTFRPADFGLDPVSCRDLILQLRDDSQSRSRLPDFDSALDLSTRPRVTGELITPRL